MTQRIRAHKCRLASTLTTWLMILAAFSGWVGMPLSVQAASTTPCELDTSTAINQYQYTLRCDLAEQGRFADTVTVFDRDEHTLSATTWKEISDFRNEVWVFDYQNNAHIDLVIEFHDDGPALVADLYDAQGDVERLSYQYKEGQFSFTSNPTPTVRVVAPDGWWSNGTRVNMNLDIMVDGLVDAAFDVRTKLTGLVTTDGKADFKIEVRDTDHDARPDYDRRTLELSARELEAKSLPHTFLMVNAADQEAPLVATFPWPYLGKETYGYLYNSPHQTTQPPIQIDWASGTIRAIGEFVSSRGNDGQWFVYSSNKVEPGGLSQPDFESPFAWYDLAQDRDRQPELAIRVGYYPANDATFIKGRFSKPLNFMRYSWDQDNNNYWDYKLGLLGTNAITSTVTLSNLNMQLLPYQDIPKWVTEQEWGIATFVAAENVHAQGEGIYEWDPSSWLTEQYFTGKADTPPSTAGRNNDILNEFKTITQGFRGEYQLDLADQAMLYFSPFDRRLHLKRAEHGLLNLGAERYVTYDNIDKDDIIDQWRVVDQGQIRQELNVAPSHIVYGGDNDVTVRQAHVDATLFETLPPRDHAEWDALNTQLTAHEHTLAADDFRAMMQQFDGPELRINGATLRDYRRTEDGFRFVLTLEPDFKTQGSRLFDLRNLEPGDYAVTFDGAFHIEPLTPPQVEATIDQASFMALQPNAVPIALHNAGSEDVSEATIELWAAANGAPATLVATDTMALVAQSTVTATLDWTPPAAGAWSLSPHVQLPDQSATPFATTEHTVLAAGTASPKEMLVVSTSPSTRAGIMLGLTGLAFAAAATFWYLGRSRMNEKDAA